jgi:drug/metabolite transporter (DMT)-like permease
MSTNTARAYTPAGLLAAATGVFGWGCGVIIIKLTTSPFLIVAFYRHVISLPILFVAWRFTKDRTLPWRAASVGGVLFAAHQIAHLSSLRYSTAAVVTILFSLQPIIVGALGHRLVGELTTKRFYTWSLVAVSGCTVLVIASSGQAGSTPLGTALAVANLVIWSAYYVATKQARAHTGAIAWMLVMTLVSGVCITVLTLAFRQPLALESGHELALLAILAIGPATGGHLLVTWSHTRVHVAASSALNLGVPIIASIGAALFLDEPFGPWQILGALIALGGTLMAMRSLPPPVAEESAERFGEVAT